MESCTSSSSGYTTSSMSSFLNATFKRSTKIPKKCFEKVTFTHDGQIYEDSSRQRALSGKSLQQSIEEARLNLNYNVTYLKSDAFAEHFNRIFKKELGDKMAFEASSVSRSETLNSTISLKKVDIDKKNKYVMALMVKKIFLLRKSFDTIAGPILRNASRIPALVRTVV